MPTYVYKCPSCNFQEEQFHSIKKDPEFPCLKCKTLMSRVIQGANFVLKGSGFYQNDYKRGGQLQNETLNHAKNDPSVDGQ